MMGVSYTLPLSTSSTFSKAQSSSSSSHPTHSSVSSTSSSGLSTGFENSNLDIGHSDWTSFTVGDLIDVRALDKKWYMCRITAVKPEERLIGVHFESDPKKKDEMVSSDSLCYCITPTCKCTGRIAQFGLHTLTEETIKNPKGLTQDVLSLLSEQSKKLPGWDTLLRTNFKLDKHKEGNSNNDDSESDNELSPRASNDVTRGSFSYGSPSLGPTNSATAGVNNSMRAPTATIFLEKRIEVLEQQLSKLMMERGQQEAIIKSLEQQQKKDRQDFDKRLRNLQQQIQLVQPK